MSGLLSTRLGAEAAEQGYSSPGERRPGRKMRRLIISSEHIDGDLDLRGISVTESIRLVDLRVSGNILLDEARALGGLDVRGLRVQGRLCLDSARIFGLLRIEDFEGSISLVGAEVEGESHLRKLELGSLSAEGAVLRGGLELERVKIREGLELSGASVAGWVDASSLEAGQITLTRARFDSGFELRGARIQGDIVAEDFQLAKDASLRGSVIEGVLRAARSTWAGRLDLVRAQAGSIALPGARCEGPIQLSEARLGALDLREAALGALSLDSAQLRSNLDLRGARIVGDLSGRGLRVEGEARLSGARLGDSSLVQMRLRGDLACEGLEAERFVLSEARVEGDVRFTGAAIQSLALAEASLERRCELRRAVLGSMELRGARVALPDLRWSELRAALGLDPAVIAENAAVIEEWLGSARRFEERDEVLFLRLQSERWSRSRGSWGGWFWAWLEWLFVAAPTGYGLRPARVLGSMIFVGLVLAMANLFLNAEIWRVAEPLDWRVLELSIREVIAQLFARSSSHSPPMLGWLSDLARLAIWLLSALFVGTLTRKMAR